MQQQYRRPEEDYGDEDEMDAGGEGDDVQPDIGERPGFGNETGDQPEGFDAGEMRRDFQQGHRGSDQGHGRDRRDRFRPRWDRSRGEGQDQNRFGNQQNQPSYQRREETEAQPVIEPERPAPVQSAEPAPAPAAEVNGVNDKWDGPQPSFLKRPAGGQGRGRRSRREAAASDAARPESEEASQAD
jgi:hypothetical protein